MSNRENEDYERDEEMLEARRLKRLEMKRKRKIQQRIVLAILAVVLILVVVLIVKGCSGKSAEKEPEQPVTPPTEPQPDPEPADPDVTATLAAVGDIMMYDSQIKAGQSTDQNGATVYDFSSCFEAITPYTISPDLMVGNLELNFCGYAPYTGSKDSAPYWNAPESLATNLADMGFDVLQTANTYSIMNGITGLQSTINFLNQAGIDHVGTHATDPAQSGSGGVVLREVNGIKFAFIGFTKGVNSMRLPTNNQYAVDLLYTDYDTNFSQVDTTSILNRVDAAKKLNPDVIVAMLHWGSEYDFTVSSTQEEITNLLFKNGVDVILGSHSHFVGPMKMMEVETTDGEKKNCFVAYSLGNFISAMTKQYTQESVILNLEFTKDGKTGKTTISDASYTPLYILDRGEGAEKRYEVLPIRAAIQTDLFQDYESVMSAAIDNLKANTQSDYDSGK